MLKLVDVSRKLNLETITSSKSAVNAPSFDEYRRICRIQQLLANELLCDRDGAVVGGAQIGEVIEES